MSLRQGDPISPFLFLIVAKGHNGIINSTIENGMFEGVEVGNNGYNILQLQFVNDIILFGKAYKDNVWAAKIIMRLFELVSCMKINFGKSCVMGINVQ